MRVALWALAGVLLAAAWATAGDPSPPAHPVREIRLGLLAHDVDGLWSGQSKEPGQAIGLELLFDRRLFGLWGATAHPNLGVHLNTRKETSSIYGGVLLQRPLGAALQVSAGLGLALHNGEEETAVMDRKSLGSPLLFRVTLDVGYALHRHHRIVLAFDHMSNAHLASPNEGLDTLGLLYAYCF